MSTGEMVAYEDVVRNANLHEGASMRAVLERAAILEALARVWPRKVVVAPGGLRCSSEYTAIGIEAAKKLFERVTLFGAGRNEAGLTWSEVADQWEQAASLK